MSEKNKTGVYQLENGYWGYRYTLTVNGKKKDVKRTKDEFGMPLKTEKTAMRAREVALRKELIERNEKPKKQRMTIREVYEEYCENGRRDKAYATILKQESLWKNHISERFGKRFVDDVSAAEIVDYLSFLYYEEDRAYRYVESFLKMFYLIFGQAYSRNYLDVDTYNTLCVNKNTKFHMPKMKIDEDTDIFVFSTEQMEALEEYFHGTNAETAYMLGRFCGLRINECYGLKWSDIDFENECIHIERQMQYQDGVIRLVPLKTRNARRTVFMNERLKRYLEAIRAETEHAENYQYEQRHQKQTMIFDTDGTQISSLLLVNSLPNGKIQTVNSMKYHAKMIDSTLGFHFKFHYLRHTYGTRLAEQNTPSHILCNQMGHGNSQVTQKYYLAVSKQGGELLKEKTNKL